MKWIYRGLMAASVIGAGMISGGIIPVAYAAVFMSVGGAAAFFHDSPSQAGEK